MKITTTSKSITALDPSFVRIAIRTAPYTRLQEKDGVYTLHISHETKEPFTLRTARTLFRSIIRTAKSMKIERLAWNSTEIAALSTSDTDTRGVLLQLLAENILIADYEFTHYKTGKIKHPLTESLITDCDAKDVAFVERGAHIATHVNIARDLANTPGGDMTPETLASRAKALAKGSAVAVTVLGKKEIQKLQMGALLGVSQGSTEEPRFIIMEYWGAGKPSIQKGHTRTAVNEKSPVVLVGKGVTFDTGGLNLKPSDAVLDMHLDMSGGGAVIAAIVCAAKLKVKKNIVALIPAAENMVSGESYRPGDVLTTMSGKTVEVLNTDAEGRLILADALTYAKRYTPKLVIDVATLTGAALVALGQHASAIMTKDTALQTDLTRLGEESGDYVWPLPLWNEYKQHTKGTFADIANIPSSGSRYGGAINGGMFLAHFTEDYRWAHIDMAPRMTPAPGDHLAKGATGEPVRLLLKIIETF